jgi:hypothetical protein
VKFIDFIFLRVDFLRVRTQRSGDLSVFLYFVRKIRFQARQFFVDPSFIGILSLCVLRLFFQFPFNDGDFLI